MHSLQRTLTLTTKRAFDVTVALVVLVALSPVIATVALTILLQDGRPVFFVQVRPGRYGIPFRMYKFRTMRSVLGSEDKWRSDAVRVTRLGRLLRRTSLDELPNLWNVLTGDMSLVGPRPLLEEYLPKYSPFHQQRHNLRPGVTGLAQVEGRRRLTLSQRFDLDVYYCNNVTLRMDAGILLRTLAEPLRGGPSVEQTIEEIDDLGFLSDARSEQNG
jgi:sugar transferase EpsL